MRLTNEHLKERFLLLYAILILAMVIDFLVSGVSGTFAEYFSHRSLSLGAAAISVIIILLGKPYFEYDSDGEVLIFKSRYFLIEHFFPSMTKTAEFPKRKLFDYKISGFIRKTLTIKIKSKSGVLSRSFNVTFLSNQKIRHLKKSLDKIKRLNKTAKTKD